MREGANNMDCIPLKEREFVIDIDSCTIRINEDVGTSAVSDDKNIGNKVSFTMCENSASISSNLKNDDELSPESANNNKREKRKSMNAKKPPKPPRPPRGLSLDAADQKLIKEISELAMMKRARIERVKALKKMKAAKASSASTSSSGNLIAMLFTVIFCIVIIFQGCHSSGISPRNRSAVPVPGSLEANGVADGNIVEHQDLYTNGVPLMSVASPTLMENIPGSNSKDEAGKTIR